MLDLAVSNILNRKGLGLDNLDAFLALLKKSGINAVELALNCVFHEPADVSETEFDKLRRILEKRAVKVASLHSLTFTRPDLELFKSSETLSDLVDYASCYIKMARKLDCENIVFGSGKARKTRGKTREECDSLFKAFLEEIDTVSDGVFFNIEPLPPSFCEYLNSYSHAFEILDAGDYENINIQLDLKALFETDSFKPEKLAAKIHYFHHAHVSDMDFSPPSEKDIDKHRQMISFLTKSGYEGSVSMEAVPGKADITPAEIEAHLKNFKNIYGQA